jgi:hypothetical protein
MVPNNGCQSLEPVNVTLCWKIVHSVTKVLVHIDPESNPECPYERESDNTWGWNVM